MALILCVVSINTGFPQKGFETPTARAGGQQILGTSFLQSTLAAPLIWGRRWIGPTVTRGLPPSLPGHVRQMVRVYALASIGGAMLLPAQGTLMWQLKNDPTLQTLASVAQFLPTVIAVFTLRIIRKFHGFRVIGGMQILRFVFIGGSATLAFTDSLTPGVLLGSILMLGSFTLLSLTYFNEQIQALDKIHSESKNKLGGRIVTLDILGLVIGNILTAALFSAGVPSTAIMYLSGLSYLVFGLVVIRMPSIQNDKPDEEIHLGDGVRSLRAMILSLIIINASAMSLLAQQKSILAHHFAAPDYFFPLSIMTYNLAALGGKFLAKRMEWPATPAFVAVPLGLLILGISHSLVGFQISIGLVGASSGYFNQYSMMVRSNGVQGTYQSSSSVIQHAARNLGNIIGSSAIGILWLVLGFPQSYVWMGILMGCIALGLSALFSIHLNKVGAPWGHPSMASA